MVYFSHTGENYNVGVIEKGNTHIIADMIADATGADRFEIVPKKSYPHNYDCRPEHVLRSRATSPSRITM